MIMEADMSCDQLSASWRLRRARGVVPVQTQRPGNQKSQWCKTQSKSKGPGLGRIAGIGPGLSLKA